MKFDSSNVRMCAYDGCRVSFSNIGRQNIKECNNRYYCSHECLEKQYRELGYDGATHLVHQKFGPMHPVTKQIMEMRKLISWFNKKTDLENRKKTSEDWKKLK